MANSKSKKQRMKKVREGNRNPVDLRGGQFRLDLTTRVTKTKQAKLSQNKHKKRFQNQVDDGIFFCA